MENETEDIYWEVDMNNLKSQNYHEALRCLCYRMSMRGIVNFIHYDHCGELLVEIKNTTEFYNKGFYSPFVDKKKKDDVIHFVLIKKIGMPFVNGSINEQQIGDVLEEMKA